MNKVNICIVICLLALVAAVSPVAAQQPLANPFEAGFLAVVPETAFLHNGVANGGNWEPYADAFGDGTLAFAAGREDVNDTLGSEATYVALFDTNNNVQVVEGFFTTTNFPNDPWNQATNDTVRTSGNPPRIGADRTPGGSNYMLGMEATPWDFPALFPGFQGGLSGTYTYTAQMACIQLIQKTGLSIAPLTQVVDAMDDPSFTGIQNNQNRFGGEVIGLSNGGYAVTVEARDTSNSPAAGNGNERWIPLTIYDAAGTRTFGPINANQISQASPTSGWSNLCAYNGGFATFHGGTNFPGGGANMNFWNNDGSPAGLWEHIVRTNIADPLPPANGNNTSISGVGGSSNRIRSHPASNFVYYVGEGEGLAGANTGAYITKIDATTRQTVKEAFVNDTFSSPMERVMAGVDSNDNVAVVWSTGGSENQMLCRTYDSNLDPTSDAFFCFTNSNNGNFTARRPTCALADDGRILIAGRFEGQGATSLPQYAGSLDDDQIGIVLQLPAPLNLSTVENWNLLD